MQVSVWNNGTTTYGIFIGKPNREHFKTDWKEIELELDGRAHSIRLTNGFWKDCPEIRSPVIRDWLNQHGLLEWKDAPPKLTLIPLTGNRFRLIR